MEKIKKFLAILTVPSAFQDDDYAEGTNQLAHVALGALLAALIASLWGYEAGIVGVALGAVAWEYWQIKKRGAGIMDSKMDALFMFLGALYPGPVWWPVICFAVWGVHMWRRL